MTDLSRQKAQDAVTTHAAMLEDLKTKCAELTTQQQEAETQCSGLAGKLAAKEEACAAQQLQLQALVKADKSKSVTYRTKVSRSVNVCIKVHHTVLLFLTIMSHQAESPC